MIYSRFDTPLTLLTKTESADGRVLVQATAGVSADVLEYKVGDLKADEGLGEINAAVAKLPMKVFENKSGRKRRPM